MQVNRRGRPFVRDHRVVVRDERRGRRGPDVEVNLPVILGPQPERVLDAVYNLAVKMTSRAAVVVALTRGTHLEAHGTLGARALQVPLRRRVGLANRKRALAVEAATEDVAGGVGGRFEPNL